MKPFDLTFVSFSFSFDTVTENTLMQLRVPKRQARSHIRVPGRTIRKTESANRNTRMLVYITATGKMASVTEKV